VFRSAFIIIIIIHEFHRDASLETKLQGRFRAALSVMQVRLFYITIIVVNSS